MSGKKKYNVALVGAGRMGLRWAGVIKKSPNASLKFIVDQNPRSAKTAGEKHRVPFSTRFRDALTKDVDAVLIVTPHKYLYPLAKVALLSGKHVFVEKPGAKTAREMNNLARIAKRKKRALLVGFNYRFFDTIDKAKRIVKDGTIGEVQSITIRHGHRGRAGYEKEWRMNKNLAGGGVLMDQGLHCIDLALWFLNDSAVKVSGALSNNVWNAKVEDTAFVILQTKKKKLASLCVSIAEFSSVFLCEIRGEKGSISIPGLGRKYGNGKVVTVCLYNKALGALSEKTLNCNPDADRALKMEFKEFIRSCSLGGRLSNAGDAAAVLEIIGKVYKQKK